MSFKRKRAAAILLACLMLAALAACNAAPTAEPDATAAPAAIDRDAIAAKVGDRDVTVGDVEDAYNSLLEMYTYYGYSASSDTDIETLQDTAVQSLVDQEMLLYQAGLQGYDVLSDEQEAELRETVDGEIDALITQFSADAETEGTDEDIRAAAVEAIDKALIEAGMDVDFDGYCAQIEEYYRNTYITTNLENSVREQASVTEDAVKEYYDTLHAEQSTAISDDPASYLASEEAFEMNGGEPMLFTPEGYIRVKALTVQPEGTLDAAYETLATEMADLEAEYGKLALSGEDSAKRLSEIKTAYAAKKLEADKLFAAYTAGAKAKIGEARAALDAGTGFDEVFASYNEDESYTTYDAFAHNGRLMMPGTDDGAWDEALRTAAKGLSAGEYSDVIEVEGSYYILYVVGPEAAGDKPLESVYSEIEALALEQAESTLWEEKQEEWSADKTLVTLYADTYRGIGK